MRTQSKYRVLVVRLGAMGDILHALPAVTALRQAHLNWTIDWVVEPKWSALLAAADGPRGRAAFTFGMIVLSESGDADRLRSELAARGSLPERSHDWSWLAMTCGLAGMAALAGDADMARHQADALAPYAGQVAMFGSDGCFGAVDEYRGRCLALLDDPAAGGCFDAAAEMHRRLRAPHLEARTLLHHGTWLAPSDPDAALVLLDRAAVLARRAPGLAGRIAAARAEVV